MFLLPERCSEASIESSSFLLGVPKCGTTTCGEPRSGVEKMNVPFSQSLSSFIEIVVQQVMRMIIRTKRKVGGGGGGRDNSTSLKSCITHLKLLQIIQLIYMKDLLILLKRTNFLPKRMGHSLIDKYHM